MDFRFAEFIRFIDDNEPLDELIDETKAGTWMKERDHAVLRVATPLGERLAMVCGGRDGILLDRQEDGTVWMSLDGTPARVSRLAWHVHPKPTGPSDHDRLLLDYLKQETSMLFEIGGPGEGTRFTPMCERSV